MATDTLPRARHVRVVTVRGTAIRLAPSCLILVGLLAIAIAPRAELVAPSIGAGAYLVGALLGVVVYAAALVHEAAHAVLARRYGHDVPSITLSVTGGRTVVDGEAATPGEEFITALVGPLVSLAIGAIALAARLLLDEGVPALALEVLVIANLVLGLLDLVPAPPLDGGRLVKAVAWRIVGSPRRGALAAAWGGRVVAVLLLTAPVIAGPAFGREVLVTDIVLCGAMALLLWSMATNEIAVNRLRIAMEGVVARDVALAALTVAPDLPLAEAIRRADEGGTPGIVTIDPDGRLLGVVNQSAVDAMPAERRPWVDTSSVTRAVSPERCLAADLSGDHLLRAIHMAPGPEYVVLEPGGSLIGVLRLADLDRAVHGT
ncbi:MAG: site-2 protease family protein [Nocardioides sp.]